jgi:hypothetical protein
MVQVVSQYQQTSRCNISREVCKKLDWKSPNGDLKARVCRDLLLKIERDGYITLPAPQKTSQNRFLVKKSRVKFTKPEKDLVGKLGSFPSPTILLVDSVSYHFPIVKSALCRPN